MNSPADIGEFLDRGAVAAALAISAETLRELERRGEGPPVIRVSPRIARYPRAAFFAYLAARTVGETPR